MTVAEKGLRGDQYTPKESLVPGDKITMFDSEDLNAKGNRKTKTVGVEVVLDKDVSMEEYQIDGDFNNLRTGVTSQTAAGRKVFAVWEKLTSNGTLEVVSSDLSSKDNALKFSTASGASGAGFGARYKGNIVSEKPIKVFIYAKYITNKPSTLRFAVNQDATTGKGNVFFDNISALSTSLQWFSATLTPSSANGTFTGMQIKNDTAEAWDIHIEKVRILDALPIVATGTPSWVNYNENILTHKMYAASYYQEWNETTGQDAFFGIFSGASGTILKGSVPTGVEMVRAPSIDIAGLSYRQLSNNALISSSNPVTSASRVQGPNVAFNITEDVSLFSTAQMYTLQNENTYSLKLEAGY